jgi:hypothetical protein
MAKKLKNKKQELTLAQQVFAMNKYPQIHASVKRQRQVVWTGPWQPSDMSGTYELRIMYAQGFRPRIEITYPILTLAPGQEHLPHTYDDGQKDICVHEPRDWNSNRLIADTIMPWISQWLYFYEIWVVTGKWFGKGTHPKLNRHAT